MKKPIYFQRDWNNRIKSCLINKPLFSYLQLLTQLVHLKITIVNIP